MSREDIRRVSSISAAAAPAAAHDCHLLLLLESVLQLNGKQAQLGHQRTLPFAVLTVLCGDIDRGEVQARTTMSERADESVVHRAPQQRGPITASE